MPVAEAPKLHTYTKEDITFAYRRSSGPAAEELVRQPDFRREDGNCQAAVQIWFRHPLNTPIPPELALSEEGFNSTGITVWNASDGIAKFFEVVQAADIVYAVPKSKEEIIDLDTTEGQRELHVAVAIKPSDNPLMKQFFEVWGISPGEYIFHATQKNGTNGTSLWTYEKFFMKYEPVRVNRLVSLSKYTDYSNGIV